LSSVMFRVSQSSSSAIELPASSMLDESHFVDRLDSIAVDRIAGPHGRNHCENRRIRVDWYET
jgi:hypothetical protein